MAEVLWPKFSASAAKLLNSRLWKCRRCNFGGAAGTLRAGFKSCAAEVTTSAFQFTQDSNIALAEVENFGHKTDALLVAEVFSVGRAALEFTLVEMPTL